MRELAFDRGRLALAVEQVVSSSSLADKVTVAYRESMVGGGQVLTLTDTSEHEWSTGDLALWEFIASLAGQGKADLGLLIELFRGEEVAVHLVSALLSGLSHQQIVPGAYLVTELIGGE